MADPTWMEAARQTCARHLLMAWEAVVLLLLVRVWGMANFFACLRLLQCAEGFCFCFFDLFCVVSSDSFFWAAFVFDVMFVIQVLAFLQVATAKHVLNSPDDAILRLMCQRGL
jgi:CHASE2 domain-containing sensor protein